MFAKKSISRVLSILLAVLLLSGTASASPLNAARVSRTFKAAR